MKIQNILQMTNYHHTDRNISRVTFGSASDISLEYVYTKHAKYIPQRMLEKIKELLQSNEKQLPQLYELHNDVYKNLFEAKSLEEAKILYPELSDVKDMTILSNNRSKAVKAVKKIMSLDKFSLSLLKKLYMPISQDNIVKEFGFSNRSLLSWLSEKLKIKKLDGSYIKLLQMSNEKENSRIAELSRKAIYANPEVQRARLEKAAKHHQTQEYRDKKQQEMINFYKRNPQVAKKTSLISQMTWDRCQEIKDAMKAYTITQSPYVKAVLSKKQNSKQLLEEEKRIVATYYRNFWENNPNFKKIYKEKRLEVIEELKNKTD